MGKHFLAISICKTEYIHIVKEEWTLCTKTLKTDPSSNCFVAICSQHCAPKLFKTDPSSNCFVAICSHKF